MIEDISKNKNLMGEFVNKKSTTILAFAFVFVILTFNFYFIVTTFIPR